MAVLTVTLVDRVQEILTRYNMLSPRGRIGVAVSGGADSVTLLYLLHQLRSRFATDLMVLHVNHELRGAESDGDEAFVRELAAKLELPIVVASGLPAPGNLEQEARRIRREFFLAGRRTHGLQSVALGHTRSDQAETVLFRLLRGSGLAGLAGMHPITSDGLIRPLLTVSRVEVREWAHAQGITWREDSSNLDPGFARNSLRLDILPALADTYNQNLEAVLAGTAGIAQAEEDYWNEQIETVYQKIARLTHLGLRFEISLINSLHTAVQRRLVRRAIAEIKGDLRSIDLQHVDAVLALCRSAQGHDRVLIPGIDALRSFAELLLTQPGTLSGQARGYSMPMKAGERCLLPHHMGSIYVRWVKPPAENCANFKGEEHSGQEEVDLDGDVVAPDGMLDSLTLRNWEPGDEMLRPGHKTADKLKSLFQENRILLWERRHWPVAIVGNEIVWAGRFGPAMKFKASQASQRILRLTFIGGAPVR
jgi:tRNA(Ile)-lysidine synthase